MRQNEYWRNLLDLFIIKFTSNSFDFWFPRGVPLDMGEKSKEIGFFVAI